MSRLEWAERDEPSPLADDESGVLLEEIAVTLGKEGRIRLARLDDDTGEAIGAALVVDDGDRAVVLAMAVDPQVGRRVGARLLHAEAMAARARGCMRARRRPPAPAEERAAVAARCSKQPVPLAIRVWGHVDHRVGRPRRSRSVARRARTRPRDARRSPPRRRAPRGRGFAASPRVSPSTIATACTAASCGPRGIVAPVVGLELIALVEADYDKLDDARRADLVDHLALDEATMRTRWHRGDQCVLATLGVRPAGIAWAARGPNPIDAPELDRTLRMSKYDAYIHSVFVPPSARGRAVAPVMLEHLAKVLRAGDSYRSWALIAADNQASLRAFQKASFTPVCDVIHAKMATVDRVVCRPPDPEAQELLGLAP